MRPEQISTAGPVPPPRSDVEHRRRHGAPSQKTMLSRALEKANTAVLLDNAHNFEGAMEAYAEAGQLLLQVMRASTGDDRKKLEAIRITYSNRIKELHTFDFNTQRVQDKALPERPLSNGTLSPQWSPVRHAEEDSNSVKSETRASLTNHAPETEPRRAPHLDPPQIPPRRHSLLPSASENNGIPNGPFSPTHDHGVQKAAKLIRQCDSTDADRLRLECLPPPLSISPLKASFPPSPGLPTPKQLDSDVQVALDTNLTELRRHSRDNSTETTSWLDTIDESGGSSASSLHSRNSSVGIHRKRIDATMGGADTELSAAMDAAVEAAYDDSFDDVDGVEAGDHEAEYDSHADVVSKAKQNVEQARQRVRQAEQEQLLQGQKSWQYDKTMQARVNSVDLDYLDEEAEEEERMLEQMTKGYTMDDFHFGIRSKTALAYRSCNSTLSGKDRSSSNTSRTATTTSTTPAALEGLPTALYRKAPPPHPPPVGALPTPPASVDGPPVPPPPSLPPPQPPSSRISPAPGVRDRRLSGQNARQLKIETHSRPTSGALAKDNTPAPAPIPSVEEESATSPDSSHTHSSKPDPCSRPPVPQISQRTPQTPLTSGLSEDSMQSESPITPALPRVPTHDTDEPVSASPARFMGMSGLPAGLKNLSSSSLKMRNLSITTAEVSDVSPITPGSASFSISADARKGPSGSTPLLPALTASWMPHGGIHLFDEQVCSPTPTLPPSASISNPPLPLEPCPEAFLLRPFWLMRCIYQTLAHPRGGYLSARLFVPRDAWRVKNVKLKNVEEKVAHCDLLTAALLKISTVDTLDADAVLEEMQSLEVVLDQVRISLHKRLGSEVGVDGAAGLFKVSSAVDDPGGQGEAPSSKSGASGGKSYLSSWRKLRSKSSGAGLTAAYSLPSKDGNRDHLSMSTLPMTSTPASRPAKRKPTQLRYSGPTADYMGALARLCDAVQILDQIARQVEDPGLKYSSKTHVGLELSIRNAAEFFAFYICRFALNDIGMMLDKFIKRGSEWVLS